MSTIRSVCVYCGSGVGNDPAYALAAAELGRRLAESGLRLVYGGGSVGLMGTIAHNALAHGGAVTGIIPQFLRDRERMLSEVTELIVTKDMHERKRLMFEHSDAFVALPGGVGTLEEVIEMMTWSQLGRHSKPILLFDINGFWGPLMDLLHHMSAQAFIRPGMEVDYLTAQRAEDVIPALTGGRGRIIHGGDAEMIARL